MLIAAITFAAALSASPHPQHGAQAPVTHGKARALSSGTPIPVGGPYQLALDGQGNLYVANAYTNDVLIYNPSFVQQTARTLSTNVNEPEGVAVDPYGNVFVANVGSSQVTEYNAAGQYERAFSNPAVLAPRNIAVDALDDLYVLNTFQNASGTSTNVAVFQKNDTASVATNLDSDINFYYQDSITTSLAVSGSNVSLAINIGYLGYTDLVTYAASSLVNGQSTGGSLTNNGLETVLGVASNGNIAGTVADSSGRLWLANAANKTIILVNNLTESVFLTCSYYPNGIAVDSARGRVYVSDLFGNAIHVYNAQTAAPIATLQ